MHIRTTALLTRGLALGTTGALIALGSSSATATADSSKGSADVYVVQGLPGVVVDVSVDGEVVAEDLATTDVAGPFEVEGGRSSVTFTDARGTVLADNTVDAKAGTSTDLVLHLPTSAKGAPTVTAFDNDLSAVQADKAAVTVAHTAAVPPADIKVNGDVLFANVANGESLDLVVPDDTYEVEIVPTGQDAPVVFGPVDLDVEGGSLNRVYAVGDPSKKTMNVAVHVIAVDETGSAEPKRVDTGMGGSANLVRALSTLPRW